MSKHLPLVLTRMAASPGTMGLLFLLTVVLLWVAALRCGAAPADGGADRPPGIVPWMLPALLSSVPMYVMTGYADARYFAFLFAFVLLVLGGRALAGLTKAAPPATMAAAGGATMLTLWSHLPAAQIQVDYLALDAPAVTCFDGFDDDGPILVDNYYTGLRLSALYGMATAFLPYDFQRNGVTVEVASEFLAAHRIRYMFDPTGTGRKALAAFEIRPLPGCSVPAFEIGSVRAD